MYHDEVNKTVNLIFWTSSSNENIAICSKSDVINVKGSTRAVTLVKLNQKLVRCIETDTRRHEHRSRDITERVAAIRFNQYLDWRQTYGPISGPRPY